MAPHDAAREQLDRIEADLRDTARIEDLIVRRVLTSVLQRQRDYVRRLQTLPVPVTGQASHPAHEPGSPKP